MAADVFYFNRTFILKSRLTCLHALGQRADVRHALGVDDHVAVDEGQVRPRRHGRLTAEALEVLGALLRHEVLEVKRSKVSRPHRRRRRWRALAYLEGSHGNHHAPLHLLRAAQVPVPGQEVMRHGHQGVPGPALEPVHGAA